MYKEVNDTITFKLSEQEHREILVEGLKARGIIAEEIIEKDSKPYLNWKETSSNVFVTVTFYLTSTIETLKFEKEEE